MAKAYFEALLLLVVLNLGTYFRKPARLRFTLPSPPLERPAGFLLAGRAACLAVPLILSWLFHYLAASAFFFFSGVNGG